MSPKVTTLGNMDKRHQGQLVLVTLPHFSNEPEALTLLNQLYKFSKLWRHKMVSFVFVVVILDNPVSVSCLAIFKNIYNISILANISVIICQELGINFVYHECTFNTDTSSKKQTAASRSPCSPYIHADKFQYKLLKEKLSDQTHHTLDSTDITV